MLVYKFIIIRIIFNFHINIGNSNWCWLFLLYFLYKTNNKIFEIWGKFKSNKNIYILLSFIL